MANAKQLSFSRGGTATGGAAARRRGGAPETFPVARNPRGKLFRDFWILRNCLNDRKTLRVGRPNRDPKQISVDSFITTFSPGFVGRTRRHQHILEMFWQSVKNIASAAKTQTPNKHTKHIRRAAAGAFPPPPALRGRQAGF